jgi:hypothetical protein
MKFKIILDKLYSGDESQVISVLDRSIYISDYAFEEGKSFVLHTGVTFYSHTNKSFALYYDLNKDTLIRQLQDNVTNSVAPPILGLHSYIERGYFNGCSPTLVTGISSDLSKFTGEEITFKDISKPNHPFKEFTIYQGSETDSIIKTYPTSIDFKTKVFISGNVIKKYISEEEYYSNSDDEDDDYDRGDSYSSRQAFRDATGGQLDDMDADEGWTSLGRD